MVHWRRYDQRHQFDWMVQPAHTDAPQRRVQEFDLQGFSMVLPVRCDHELIPQLVCDVFCSTSWYPK